MSKFLAVSCHIVASKSVRYCVACVGSNLSIILCVVFRQVGYGLCTLGTFKILVGAPNLFWLVGRRLGSTKNHSCAARVSFFARVHCFVSNLSMHVSLLTLIT